MTAGAADLLTAFIRKILRESTTARPVIFGLNGPQGCGKTTATSAAVALLRSEHQLPGIAISIDDFYLTRTEQLALAQAHAENPYLQQRGYPGTHDIRLGSEVLSKLKTINRVKQPVALPRYDKSLHDGEGDRLPEASWPKIAPPVDFVILEGWCVGFTPVEESGISDPHLIEINRLLARYKDWHRFFDAFIQFKAQDIRDTVHWRIEAEQNMRAQGKTAMSEERIKAYIERFLPAYDMYLPALGEKLPPMLPRLAVEITADRRVARKS